MTPRVSIIMGVFNAGTTLAETLDSLIEQTLRDWELIVVNDASTDQTMRVLDDYAAIDDRIKVIHLGQNQGLTHALIIACQAARGEFLARQDAGDISLPQRLARQVLYLNENHEVVAVGLSVKRIGPMGENLGNHVRNLTPHEVTKSFVSTGQAIIHPSAMIRRSAYVSAGGYRIQFRVAQDIDLWYRLLKFGLLAELNEVLFCFRIDTTGITARNTPKQHALASIARLSFLAASDQKSDTELLAKAASISGPRRQEIRSVNHKRKQIGDGNYFLGSELFRSRHPNCRQYLLKSMLCRTHVFGSVCKYVLSFVNCNSSTQTNRQ